MRRSAAIELNDRGRRLWLSLGVIGVVAAGAIAGILKFEFPGGGVAHTVVTRRRSARIDGRQTWRRTPTCRR
jgi:hypothetical protein